MKTKTEAKNMPMAPNKPRKCASVFQVRELEKTFESDPRPSHDKRIQLAKRLDMMPRTVQIWFQNRRAKARSQNHLMVKAVNCPTADQDPFKSKLNMPYCFSPQTNLDCFMDSIPDFHMSPQNKTPPTQAFASYDFSYPPIDPWGSFTYDPQLLDLSLNGPLGGSINGLAPIHHLTDPMGGMVGSTQPDFFQSISHWPHPSSSYPQPYSRHHNPPMYSMSYPPLLPMIQDEHDPKEMLLSQLSSENNS